MENVTYKNESGDEITVSAADLEGLAKELAEAGYDGPSIRVYKDNGETRGWVSANEYRYA